MFASPAALHRSRLYRLVARVVIVSLLLQGLIPVPGPGTPVAQAGNGDPPLPVTIVEPDAPVLPPEPVVTPDPIVAVPPGVAPITVTLPVTPPVTLPDPGVPITDALPVTLTLSAAAPQATAGDLVLYTVVLESRSPDPLVDLQLEADLPAAVEWPGAAGWLHSPRDRVISMTLPVVPPRARLTRTFATRLIGMPEGEVLQQFVRAVQPGMGASHARAPVRVANPIATAAAGPHGGVLVSHDQRVRVEVPPDALTTTVRLEQRWQRLGALDTRHPARHFFILQLEAYDPQTGQAIHAFNRPVTLTLRLGDLVPAGETFTLSALNEGSRSWEPVSGELALDATTGAVQVPLRHFRWYGGSDPSKAGWTLLLNDTTAGLGNGSLNYAVGIEIPPGRHALAPTLQLSYNSGRANGLTSWVQSQWAGIGWDLEGVQITRGFGLGLAIGGHWYSDADEMNPYSDKCAHETDLCFNDDFTLVFGGLVYRGGSRTANNLTPNLPMLMDSQHSPRLNWLQSQGRRHR